MEWNRRVALEKEMARDPKNTICHVRLTFDHSSNFLIYPTPLGINVYNLVTQKIVRQIGSNENLRFLGKNSFYNFWHFKLKVSHCAEQFPVLLWIFQFYLILILKFIKGKIARSGDQCECWGSGKSKFASEWAGSNAGNGFKLIQN